MATRNEKSPELRPVRKLKMSPRQRSSPEERPRTAQFTMNEHQAVDEEVVVVMVGVPARGKSFISNALMRYLNFLGCATQMFNAGQVVVLIQKNKKEKQTQNHTKKQSKTNKQKQTNFEVGYLSKPI